MAKMNFDGVMVVLDLIMIAVITYAAITSEGWMAILMWTVAGILLLLFVIRIRRAFSGRK